MKDYLYQILARITFSRLSLWKILPDELYLKVAYMRKLNKELNLHNPVTFNEKLQWLKIHDRRPEYTKMVDKYEVKKYVAGKIGYHYIVPTLGVWNHASEIDWDRLPNEFVLKCTHDSGGVVICNNKSELDKKAVLKKLNTALRRKFWKIGREWPYKNVKPRILAEELLKVSLYPKDLPDYKWYCFDGEPKYCQVPQGHNNNETLDFFDTEWNHHNFCCNIPTTENTSASASHPINMDEHIGIARKLSEGFPFTRIDLYEVGYKVYFCEITHYTTSDIGEFSPMQHIDVLGKMTVLPPGGKFVRVAFNDNEIITTDIDNTSLRDYKFFCFHGVVKFFKIDIDRFSNHRANYYDLKGNQLDFGEVLYPPDFTHHETIPSTLPEMISLAEKLSENIPFVRIDFYSVKNKVYFGEMTFYPASGLGEFFPEGADKKIGDYICLSN